MSREAAPPVDPTVLLKFITAMATIKERKALFTTILNEVKPYISVDDTGLLVLDNSGEYWQDWTTVDKYQETQAASQLQELGYDRFQPMDRCVEYFLHHSGVVGVAQFMELYPEHPFGAIMWEVGLREMMFTPLVNGGKKLGVLFFDSEQQGTYTQEHLPLFQGVADQVAVAVANILANEEILAREWEKIQLLEITELIAQVKATDDLLRLIVNKIKPLFGFHDCGLFVVSPNGKTHSDLAAVLPDVSPSEWNQAIASVSTHVDHPGSPVEWMIKELETAHRPVLFDFKDLMERFPTYPQLNGTGILEMGYRDCLAASLTVRGKSIGLFCINALQKDYFSPALFSLFRSVTHNISIAVANILANEEILEREREKSVLLSISEDIASVRDKKDLLRVIIEKIKPLFGFYDCGILVIDHQNHFHDLAAIHPDINGSEVNHLLHSAGYYQHGQGIPYAGLGVEWIIKQIQQAGRPILFDYSSDHSHFTDGKLLANLEGSGYREAVAGVLKTGGRVFGCFTINYTRQGQTQSIHLPLFQNVVDQLSVAVANILANEEILEREREKTLLLSLSEDMATIRNREDLLQVILSKIKPIMGFDDATVSTYSKDISHYRHFITASPTQTKAHPLFEALVGKYHPVAGTPDAHTFRHITAQEVFCWPTEEMIRAYPDHPIGYFLKEINLHHNAYLKLSWAGSIIGFVSFHFAEPPSALATKYPLLKAIADQVAVAVANILANEEILEQKAQIEALKNKLEQENLYLQEEVGSQHDLGEIIGSSPPMRAVFAEVRQVAPADTTVLILGETGTGKELIARALHRLSPRKARPLVKLNCAALPAQLIESELFGHEKGAFTGAIDRRIGKFEVASGSTLFLDEIGELPLELQSKLLRAIQEKEIERLGSNKVITCDVRIIAATNRDLGKEVRGGRFRADLYYRLSVFPLTLPPLRERKEDIPLLAMHFVDKYAHKLGRKITGIATGALKEMLSYEWPGNVREMEHVVERATLRATTATLKEMNLVKKESTVSILNHLLTETPILKTLDQVEREAILLALQHCQGKIRGKGGAAEILGVIPNTLDYRMKRLGIVKQHLVRK
jgi:transcriptional regulator with GAF, ATPase, and Fis domain